MEQIQDLMPVQDGADAVAEASVKIVSRPANSSWPAERPQIALHSNVDGLILAIGSRRLSPMLFDWMRAEFGIEHAVIVEKHADAPVEVRYAKNAQGSSFTRELCTRYANYDHLRDPVLAALGPARQRELIVCSVAVPDIHDAGYRSRFFLEPDFAGKASIIARRPDHLLYLNFYRSRRNGTFCEEDLRKLNACSPLIGAIAEKHFSLTAPAGCSVETMIEVLRGADAASGLSPRELHTCARIAIGQPIARIAQELGISKNSAVTFRRRAFAKLGLGTHRDLYLLLLSKQHRFQD